MGWLTCPYESWELLPDQDCCPSCLNPPLVSPQLLISAFLVMMPSLQFTDKLQGPNTAGGAIGAPQQGAPRQRGIHRKARSAGCMLRCPKVYRRDTFYQVLCRLPAYGLGATCRECCVIPLLLTGGHHHGEQLPGD